MIADHFDHIQDHRHAQGQRHRLDHILTIALCAVVSGSDGWDDIAVFADAWEPWLNERLGLQQGVPSADTIHRVISTIEPDAFEPRSPRSGSTWCFARTRAGCVLTTAARICRCSGG